MQISLKWVNELVNIQPIKLNDLIEKLTLGGFEVEEIIEVKIKNQKEIILEISSTANRSDSLSIQGISKEIAVLLNKPIKSSNYLFENLNWQRKIENESLTISEKYYCSTFSAMTIENLTDFTIPNWVKEKVISSGYTPTNDLRDFQTYILLETGYPFEFYDLTKLYSKLNTSKFNLTIETENEKMKFLATNEITYNLNNSISLIKANGIPISIAGIISNKEFSYSKDTTALLIEGSIFNSTEIRRKSRDLNLRTDRSARYEKSLKNTHLLKSFYKLLLLLKISNPNLVIKFHTLKEIVRDELTSISLNYTTIREILGPIRDFATSKLNYITPEQITNYLTQLDLNYIYDKSNNIWVVTIPYARSEDLTREIDLVEEIGRLHGFNNFLTRLPKIKTIGREDSNYQLRKKIISCLLNLGFNELIHYSLINETTIIDNKIKLLNPLIDDYSYLRSTLLPSLVKTIIENLKQGNKPIEGFEFGHVFLGENFEKLEEREYLSGIFGGIEKKLTWSDQAKPINWFEAKGKIEQFFKQINIVPKWTNAIQKNLLLHPYRNAELYLSDKNYLGIFGQINPIVAKKLNIPFNLYLFEFDFEAIQNQIQINKLTTYKEYFSYPKIVKDLSIIINKDISFEEIQSFLYLNGTQFLYKINLVDEYKGSNIPEKSVSLCFQLTFQSNEKTLEKNEIEGIIKHLKFILKNQFNAQIRS